MLLSLFFFFGFSFFFFSRYYWHLICCFFFVFSFFFCFFFYFNLVPHFYVCGFFCFDVLSSSLILLSLWISSLMILASYSVYFFNFSGVSFLFCVFFLCFCLFFCFSFSNFFFFYLFFEFSLVPTFFLILGWGYQPERIQAGLYMMLYTICASLPLLIIIFLFFELSGSLCFFFPFFNFFVFSGLFGFLFFCFFCIAFFVKVPIYFFHLWLPKAHVEAPVAGSMILAGVLLKLGGYGLIRFFFLFPYFFFFYSSFFMVLGLWGALVTSFICMRQVDVKALVAYSSVGHMGLFVGGLGASNFWGWSGCLLIMIAHGLCSSAMFSLCNLIYESLGSRSMFLCKGMLNIFPFLCFWWFVFSVFNMAAPPSLNIFGELILITSILSNSFFWCFFLGVLSFLAGGYSLYLFTSSQHGSPLLVYNFFSLYKQRSYSMLFFHFFPLSFFFFSLDYFYFFFV